MSKLCELCGEPMSAGEEVFRFHGYSGLCPKLPPSGVLSPTYLDTMQAFVDDGGQLSHRNGVDLLAEVLRLRKDTQ